MRPGSIREFHVVGVIAHNKRTPQVDAILLGRLMQEMGIGLDALAAVAAAMRADVGGGDRQPRLGQHGDHMGVDPLHLLQGEDPSATPG